MTERIAIVTGGGDCPGLNAVIRAVVNRPVDVGEFVSTQGMKFGRSPLTKSWELLTDPICFIYKQVFLRKFDKIFDTYWE